MGAARDSSARKSYADASVFPLRRSDEDDVSCADAVGVIEGLRDFFRFEEDVDDDESFRVVVVSGVKALLLSLLFLFPSLSSSLLLLPPIPPPLPFEGGEVCLNKPAVFIALPCMSLLYAQTQKSTLFWTLGVNFSPSKVRR